MRTLVIAACLAMLTRPAHAQLHTISAARAAVSVRASDGAVDRRMVKYVAGGAALGAAAAVAGGALYYIVFAESCALDHTPCGSPHFVKLGILGAVAGAVAGAYMGSRQRENGNRGALRVTPLPGTDGLAVRILFR